jgi:flavin-dependent dehydrogenase
LVDPVVGEGIAYAIESGRVAADVVSSLCTGKYAEELFVDPPLDGAEGAAEVTRLFEHYRDCRVYHQIIRNGIARRLNLIRLKARLPSLAPTPIYGTLALT